MSIKIERLFIHNYRSITTLDMEFPINRMPIVICGPNNVGKTNILRALNLFFYDDFNAFEDIPYHIAEGSRGQGFKTTIKVHFKDDDERAKYKIEKTFSQKKIHGINQNIITKKGIRHILRKEKKKLLPKEIDDYLNSIWYIFVEASNINLPDLIKKIVKNDILSLGLDRLRKRQQKPLTILQKFISESKHTLVNIETQIGANFKEFIRKNDIIKGIKDWDIQINFPKFDNLRDAISDMVTFTLYDTNKRKLDSKGSGIQRILFLSLVKYISENTKRDVIWGLDEPEVFLQPGLQKEVFKILKDLAIKLSIILTTHSHHFIDLNEINNCFLLTADYEIKNYVRRPNEEYFKVDTKIDQKAGLEKIIAIREQMGINTNDSWEVLPYNLLVEGQDDKDYIQTLCQLFNIQRPNIFIANGVDKYPGYLSFLEHFCTDLTYKPIINCIFDHDNAGKNKYSEIKIEKYKNIEIQKLFITRFDEFNNEKYYYEIEDFIYPELIADAINKIMDKKGYKKINKTDFIDKKNRQAYIKDSILKYSTEFVRDYNQDKELINFESLDIKFFICKLICNNINGKEILELDKKYPIVKKYLEKICKAS
jgi:predicted ATP-dependent endonuclease of OLD family